LQAAFVDSGIAGTFGPAGGDFVGMTVNNAAANKLDHYLEREIRYDVRLTGDGWAEATTTVRMSNLSPEQRPLGVLGHPPEHAPHTQDLSVGDNLALITQWCAPGCTISETTADGEPLPVGLGRLGDLPLATASLTLAPGETTTLSYATRVPDAWEGTENGGTYRLRLQIPPAIRAPDASVTIHLPAAARSVAAPEGAEAEGDTVTWRGSLATPVEFRVSFAAGLGERLWDGFWETMRKPVHL
jgi:hypothetical protein